MEVAQLVKYLPGKREELNLIPRNLIQMSGVCFISTESPLIGSVAGPCWNVKSELIDPPYTQKPTYSHRPPYTHGPTLYT